MYKMTQAQQHPTHGKNPEIHRNAMADARSLSVAHQGLTKRNQGRSPWWLSLIAIACVGLVGCEASTSDVERDAAEDISNYRPRLNGPATVQMVVNGGTITVALDGGYAPVTAGNFVDLVQRGIYDDTSFHRVVREPEPFVAQGGDPQSKSLDFPVDRLGTGNFIDPTTGAPRYIPLEITPAGEEQPIYGDTFPALNLPKPPQLPHTRGAIAMARSEIPNSASAQFYFALSDLPFLDGQYAVFGYVIEGMEIIDNIQQGDRIESATVISGIENLEQ